jgi:hypothetical protein
MKNSLSQAEDHAPQSENRHSPSENRLPQGESRLPQPKNRYTFYESCFNHQGSLNSQGGNRNLARESRLFHNEYRFLRFGSWRLSMP